MNVGKICRRDIVTLRTSDELVKAAELMRGRHIGYLVVVEPDLAGGAQRAVGVLTDRDIVVSVVARGVDARTLRVGEVMTQQPMTIGESESIAAALRDMRRIGVRRMPVTGQHGELVGVLSIDDVLDVLAGELQNVAGSIRNEQQIEGAVRP